MASDAAITTQAVDGSASASVWITRSDESGSSSAPPSDSRHPHPEQAALVEGIDDVGCEFAGGVAVAGELALQRLQLLRLVDEVSSVGDGHRR